MAWTNEVTLEFLMLYEQEPVIWDPKNPQHRNRDVVNDAWKRIQNSLSIECSVYDLKKKKESLMATFRPLLNKFKTSRKTDSVYRPTWFAFEIMARFLHGIYQPRTTTSTEDLVVIADDTDCEQNGEEANEEDEEFQTLTAEDEGEEKRVAKIFSRNVTVDNISTSPSDRQSRKSKRSSKEKSESHACKIMKTVTDNDECSLFADLLVTRLRTFDEQTRDILMHEIENLVFKAKMQQRKREFQDSRVLDSCSEPNRSYNYARPSQKHSPYSTSSPDPLQIHSYHSHPSPGCSNLSPNSP